MTLARGALLLACLLATGRVAAEQPPPTLVWSAAQLIPSPTVGWDGRARNFGPTFGLRWQLTPVLWSFGIHRAAPTRFRFFVVEPTYRTSGSVELHLGPEWLNRDRDELLARTGARLYLPVVERGEGLAVSIGSGAWIDRTGAGPELEVGVYALAGLLGLQVGWAPGLEGARFSTTLRVRVL